MASGYAHRDYAASLAEFGVPRHLPRSDSWLLERAIPDSDHRDAMGPYPLWFCAGADGLAADLDDLADELVSVVVVADPFGPLEPTKPAGFDRVEPFKAHFVTDLERPLEEIVRPSHRTNVRRAHRHVEVALVEDPPSRLDRWLELWTVLCDRHGIDGLRAFSPTAFAAQLAVPGIVMFEARAAGEIVGLDLWYVHDDVAYGHLVAFSDEGYRLRASYATKWAVLEHFAAHPRVRWLDLGGGAGAADADDGLSQFKRGWATGTRIAHLCSRILRPDVYDELTRRRDRVDTAYVPAYRAGELA